MAEEIQVLVDDTQEDVSIYIDNNPASGGGVQSVTGDGVSGTAEDVVLTFPEFAELNEGFSLTGQGLKLVRVNAAGTELEPISPDLILGVVQVVTLPVTGLLGVIYYLTTGSIGYYIWNGVGYDQVFVDNTPLITSKTGTTIDFTENALYNEITYLTSGNLTLDLTDAVKGTVQMVWCDRYIPTITGAYKKSSGILEDTKVNILSFLYDGTQVLLNVGAIEILSPPSLTLTAGDTEMVVDWGTVLGADNYVIERDTDSGFPSPTEVYNGPLLTYTDTGLTNGTTYYYRSKTVGNGYITSDFGDAVSATPAAALDPSLLAWWDASDDASVTTPNGSVTQWNDKTDNNNDLVEATNTPTHSSANDTVSFAGVHNTSHDALSVNVPEFDFQQSDDFTILIKGLKIPSGSAVGQRILHNKASQTENGWDFTTDGSQENFYFGHKDGTTANLAVYNNPSGWDDDTERDFILINDGGTLKIYDDTNTNVGTNGSTSIGAITYGSTVFKIGVGNLAISWGAFTGSIKEIKVWDKALDSTERDTELGL